MVARNEIYWADLGPPAGRRPVCVIPTVPVLAMDLEPVGHLDVVKRVELDRALRYSLDIAY